MRWFDLGLRVCFLVMAFGCTGPITTVTRETAYRIDRVNLSGVRFFRPDYEVSEWDDFSHQNREFICTEPGSFWESILIHFEQVNRCLNSLKLGTVTYRFIKQNLMELRLDEGSPECLGQVLPQLALPREIYFMAVDQGSSRQGVFAVSFNPRTRRVIDLPFLEPKPKVVIKTPLSRELKSRKDLEAWLKTLIFALFQGEQGFRASYVPEFTAKRCFKGDAAFFDKLSGRLEPVFWP